MVHNDAGTHMNGFCVCSYALKKNEVNFTLDTFLFEDTFLHDLVATSFFEASNHQPKTTNQIQEKHHFDMEYMPRQTKNLTGRASVSPFASASRKTSIVQSKGYHSHRD